MNGAITLTEDTTGVDWIEFCALFRRVGFGEREPELARRLFAASYACCFAWDQSTLIGAARAISDGMISAAVYDVVVDPAYQGQGVGRALMNNLLGQLPKRSVMLVSTHGSEGFYQRLGFKRLRTAYILQEDVGPWLSMGYLDEGPTLANTSVDKLYEDISALTDKEVLDLANLKMEADQDERLGALQAKDKAEGLTQAEQFELLALMQIYRLGLLHKAQGLAEAVRRGLREPLHP